MNTIEDTTSVVVVTGGGSGIGRAIAEAFVRDGSQVVIIGRREDTLRDTAQALGASCHWQRADVSQPDQVTAAIQAIVAQFGKIDVLVNNAGFSRGVMPDMALEQAAEVWDEELDTNLKGAFLMAFAVTPHLPRPGGRIINISSDGAFTGAGVNPCNYVP